MNRFTKEECKKCKNFTCENCSKIYTEETVDLISRYNAALYRAKEIDNKNKKFIYYLEEILSCMPEYPTMLFILMDLFELPKKFIKEAEEVFGDNITNL